MVAFAGHWYAKSPMEILEWWSDEIFDWYNDAVKVHNQLNAVDDKK